MLAAEFTGGYPSFGFAENTDDLFVGKTLLHGDVLMWLMKTLLTSGCTNQRGAGQFNTSVPGLYYTMLISRVWSAYDTIRSEERFSRNAETDLVCRLLLE